MHALVSSAWERRPDNSLSIWRIRFFKWFSSKPSVIWWLISFIMIPWYKKFWKWTLMCSSISSLYVVIASRRIAWWCFLDSFFFLIERLRCDCVLILRDLWAREWVVWHISKYLHTLFSVSSPLNFRGAPLNLFCGIESNLLDYHTLSPFQNSQRLTQKFKILSFWILPFKIRTLNITVSLILSLKSVQSMP